MDVRLLGRGGLSGVEEYTTEVFNHLIKADAENSYTLFYNGLRKKPLPGEWLQKKNVSVIDSRMPNRLMDLSVRTFSFPKIDRFIKTDLIFSPHFNILKSFRAPRIMTFHDLSFIHHPYFFSFRQKFWNWLQDYKKQAKAAAKIIADSEFTKSDLINELEISEEKIAVIYPGINPLFKKLDHNNPALNEFKKKYSLNFPYLLYLGTLEPRKNIPAVIRAFSWLKDNPHFKDLRLVIAGRPGWLYKDILKEAAASKSKNHIIFWGPVESAHRVFLYNLAWVFVYPSFFEGFGFPPLEAQACGSPTIVADRTSLPEVVENSALLVNPWKIEELKNALEEILTNETTKTRLIKAGFGNVRRFTWEQTANQILKIFNSAYGK